jgi:RNA polymerase sigma-70 factor, ECF subfamily
VTAAGQGQRSVEARLRSATGDGREALLQELALGAAGGDADSTTSLVWAVRHFGLARPAIRQYLFREVDVEVAEQQVLLAVAFRVGSYRGESRFTTWLQRVAANEAKQTIRSEARHRDRTVGLDGDEPGDRLVHRISSMVADQAVVRRELERLPDLLRRALLLREREDLTYEEIALALEVPVGTAKTWVRRGRARLAAQLADQLGSG